jgi:hypothetical protein
VKSIYKNMEILEKWRSKLGDLHYFQLLHFLRESKKDILIDRMLVISSSKPKLQRQLLGDIMHIFDEDDFTNELYSEYGLTKKRFLILQNPDKTHIVKSILAREDCTVKSIFYSSTFIPTVNIIAVTNKPFFEDDSFNRASYFIYL